jgi:hypothetical protein
VVATKSIAASRLRQIGKWGIWDLQAIVSSRSARSTLICAHLQALSLLPATWSYAARVNVTLDVAHPGERSVQQFSSGNQRSSVSHQSQGGKPQQVRNLEPLSGTAWYWRHSTAPPVAFCLKS